jgi:hypothetical protein
MKKKFYSRSAEEFERKHKKTKLHACLYCEKTNGEYGKAPGVDT